MTASQLSLFSDEPRGSSQPAPDDEADDIVPEIRAELQATLLRVSTATTFPFPDLTRATLAELRFKSIAGWLPDAEAAELRTAFAAEMRRLYQFVGEA